MTEEEVKYWRIGDFHKLAEKRSVSTVDSWFKQLEENKIHYVSREVDSGQKIYDELDLNILRYIDKRRKDNNIPFKLIMDELVDRFELRPFPPEEAKTDNLEVLDLYAVQKRFTDAIEKSAEENAAKLKDEVGELISHQMSQMKLLLEEQSKLMNREHLLQEKEQEREQRLIESLTARRVESKLRKEALKLWSEKPDNERMIKTGLFSKSENVNKRDLFIEDYIEEHYDREYKNLIDNR